MDDKEKKVVEEEKEVVVKRDFFDEKDKDTRDLEDFIEDQGIQLRY